ncbi:MAG: M67 family metallopeptidase [Bacteroidales bacterium]|jgi:proteasome lid subunit RPN8/RPN11|nr:M67 family metallopeptidase [Bacteroidales bacterium]
MLKISPAIIAEIIEQARTGLPEEICGYLAGTGNAVTRRFPLTNIEHSPEHFSMSPAEQFNAVRQARQEGLTILAGYHSHPSSPARPSEEDIRLAADPNISYIIVSLATEPPVVRAFRINGGTVTPEEIAEE